MTSSSHAAPGGTAGAAARSPGGRAFFERFPRAKPMLLLALLVVVLNAATVRHVSAISPIDEQLYIDHLYKAADLSLNQRGDLLSEETLREFCARKAQFREYACKDGTIAHPEKIGLNYVQPQPLYFFATGLTAKVLQAVSPVTVAPNNSLITYARLLGAAWLLLGFYFVLRIAEYFRIRRNLVVFGLVLASGTPALLHATTIVNTDAASFAAGSAVVLAALAWEQRHRSVFLPALATLFLAALKLPNTAAVGAVLVYLAARAFMSRRREAALVPAVSARPEAGARDDGAPDASLRPWRDYVVVIAVIVVAALIAIRGWELANDLLRHVIGDPDVDLDEHPERIRNIIEAYRLQSGISIQWLLGPQVVPRLLVPIEDVALPVSRVGGLYETLGVLDKYLLIASIVGLVLVARRFTTRFVTLAVSTLVAALVLPTLFVLYWNVVQDTNDAIYPRYGLSILPVFVLLLAMTVQRSRVGARILGVLAVATWGTALVTNFTGLV